MKKILLPLLFIPLLIPQIAFALGGGGGIWRYGNNAAFVSYTSEARLTEADFAAYTSTVASTLQDAYDGGATITTDATNDEVIIKYGGDNGLIQEWQKSDGTPRFSVWTTGVQFATIHLADIKSSGTNGGSAAVGWNIKTINTEITDNKGFALISSVPTSFKISVGSDTKTFDFCIRSPLYTPAYEHTVRLWDITNGVSAASYQGIAGHIGTDGQDVAVQCGYITVTGTVSYRIEHYAENTVATVGLGWAVGTGDSEHYTDIILNERLGVLP